LATGLVLDCASDLPGVFWAGILATALFPTDLDCFAGTAFAVNFFDAAFFAGCFCFAVNFFVATFFAGGFCIEVCFLAATFEAARSLGMGFFLLAGVAARGIWHSIPNPTT
jgi:hypothetical protein